MSGPTVRVRFAKARTKRPRGAKGAPQPSRQVGPSRLARMLALAHCIERMVEAGELTGYAEAARALGLTRARMTQVMNLLLLSPDLQGRILVGGMTVSERYLRTAVAGILWEQQRTGIKCHVHTSKENL